MDWQIILALLVIAPIIVFPAVFIWYMNAGALHAAIKEKGTYNLFAALLKVVRIGVAVMVPLGSYGAVMWYGFGHFGWPVALALALVWPIILLIPVVVWVAAVSGLYQVAMASLRQRAGGRRRTIGRPVTEPVIR